MTVTKLKPVERGYNAEVVSHLEAMLQRAKSGKILSLAYVIERSENLFTFSCTGCDNRFTQLGMAYRMAHELQLHMDNSSIQSSFIDGDV